jgi:hypothetical protein
MDGSGSTAHIVRVSGKSPTTGAGGDFTLVPVGQNLAINIALDLFSQGQVKLRLIFGR